MLRLNQPLIQAVNFLAYPLQLALLIPFLRAGEWLFGAPHTPLSPARIAAMARADLPGRSRPSGPSRGTAPSSGRSLRSPAGLLIYRLARPASRAARLPRVRRNDVSRVA